MATNWHKNRTPHPTHHCLHFPAFPKGSMCAKQWESLLSVALGKRMSFDHIACGFAHSLQKYQKSRKGSIPYPSPMTNAKSPEIKKGMLSHNFLHSGISSCSWDFELHCKTELVNEQGLKIHSALACVRIAESFINWIQVICVSFRSSCDH